MNEIYKDYRNQHLFINELEILPDNYCPKN